MFEVIFKGIDSRIDMNLLIISLLGNTDRVIYHRCVINISMFQNTRILVKMLTITELMTPSSDEP